MAKFCNAARFVHLKVGPWPKSIFVLGNTSMLYYGRHIFAHVSGGIWDSSVLLPGFHIVWKHFAHLWVTPDFQYNIVPLPMPPAGACFLLFFVWILAQIWTSLVSPAHSRGSGTGVSLSPAQSLQRQTICPKPSAQHRWAFISASSGFRLECLRFLIWYGDGRICLSVYDSRVNETEHCCAMIYPIMIYPKTR